MRGCGRVGGGLQAQRLHGQQQRSRQATTFGGEVEVLMEGLEVVAMSCMAMRAVVQEVTNSEHVTGLLRACLHRNSQESAKVDSPGT